MKQLVLTLGFLLMAHAACATPVTSSLYGLDLRGVSVTVMGPETSGAVALNLYALNVISQMGITVGNPSAPDAALVMGFNDGVSLKLFETTTGPRGFVARLATWEITGGYDQNENP